MWSGIEHIQIFIYSDIPVEDNTSRCLVNLHIIETGRVDSSYMLLCISAVEDDHPSFTIKCAVVHEVTMDIQPVTSSSVDCAVIGQIMTYTRAISGIDLWETTIERSIGYGHIGTDCWCGASPPVLGIRPLIVLVSCPCTKGNVIIDIYRNCA